MITGKSIAEIEKTYGTTGVTFTHQHVFELTKMSIIPLGSEFKRRGTDGFKVPSFGLVRIAYLKRSGGSYSTTGKTLKTGHLVVVKDGMIYDPSGTTYPVSSIPANKIIDSVLEIPQP
jgi:hypothetical protein